MGLPFVPSLPRSSSFPFAPSIRILVGTRILTRLARETPLG